MHAIGCMESVPELELQQELQRYVTQLTDRVTQATELLERSMPVSARNQALQKNLLYVSSAVEIATGPSAQIGLVDMIVFVRLSRTVLEKHWIPELYGKQGAALVEVFTRSEDELWTIAEQTMTRAQREQLIELIDAWLAANPGQIRVEGIRLADFSTAAGAAAGERSIQAKGLLSSVKTATQAANQALLLTERALFLLHRMPFLWRLQARLAAREMLQDAIAELSEGPQSPLARLTAQAGQLFRRVAIYLLILGGAVMTLWLLAARR